MTSRDNEMYHLRHPGRALTRDELVQLHQVQALLDTVTPRHSQLPLMDDPTHQAAAAAFQGVVLEGRQMHVATGGRRAAQVTRDVLRDIARHVSNTPPKAITDLLGVRVRSRFLKLCSN